MKGMTLRAVAEVSHGIYHGDEAFLDKEISSVTTDSRKIEKDGMFIAICGARSDGHDYIGRCFDDGAACCVSQRELPGEKRPYIQVESSLEALKQIAAFYRRQLDIKVVGITGSVGKTSTKETIASVLSRKYRVRKTQGNFNNEIGLPLTVFTLREDDEIAVLEMGISDFGEMTRLTAIAQPDICVITNIGLCHLENLKTRDGILKAKTEIFKSMNPNGTVVLNGDDDKLVTIREVYGKKPVFFGIENRENIYAKDIVNNGLEGMTAVLCNVRASDGVSEFKVSIPVAGEHMVYNAMAAAAVGAELGLSSREIADGIAELETISGRNHIIKTESILILDDCYNANPVSMKAAVDVLASARGRKVAVLGSMFELGAEEEKLHYQVGEHIAEKNIDVLLTVGELASHIARGAEAYLQSAAGYSDAAQRCEIHVFETKEELSDKLSLLLKKGDNVLVKASHGMEFPYIVKKLEELEL